MSRDFYRVIDANFNRLKEGIRVVEDTARYLLDDMTLAGELKKIRHEVEIKSQYESLMNSRDSLSDVLSNSDVELMYDDIKNIVVSNFRRAQESARVLEEYLKLDDSICDLDYKDIRYRLYDLEKKFFSKLTT